MRKLIILCGLIAIGAAGPASAYSWWDLWLWHHYCDTHDLHDCSHHH